jgi:hypothetical protein
VGFKNWIIPKKCNSENRVKELIFSLLRRRTGLHREKITSSLTKEGAREILFA